MAGFRSSKKCKRKNLRAVVDGGSDNLEVKIYDGYYSLFYKSGKIKLNDRKGLKAMLEDLKNKGVDLAKIDTEMKLKKPPADLFW